MPSPLINERDDVLPNTVTRLRVPTLAQGVQGQRSRSPTCVFIFSPSNLLDVAIVLQNLEHREGQWRALRRPWISRGKSTFPLRPRYSERMR